MSRMEGFPPSTLRHRSLIGLQISYRLPSLSI
jgi:hypothetical protein